MLLFFLSAKLTIEFSKMQKKYFPDNYSVLLSCFFMNTMNINIYSFLFGAKLF